MTDRTNSVLDKLKRIALLRLLTLMALAILFHDNTALAAPPENMPIWRARIYLQTFNAPDAGSDDSVRVELGSSNGTWVDSGFDDWEIGARTYDLRLDGISRVSDIDYLRISKPGSGGWCIGRIRLIINGVALYDEQFPSGLWLDNSGGHSTVYFIDDYFMRQRAEWINYVVPTRPDVVPVGDMRSRIEALFGDFLTSTNGDLGFRSSNSVGIWTLDADSWRVNVDIEDIKPFPVPDQNVDVDFDLTVAWTGSFIVKPDFRVENLNVDYTWPGYGGGAQSFMNNDFMPRLNAMMKNFTYLSRTGIQLAPNGDLHFLPIVIAPGGPITIGATASEAGRLTRAVEISNHNLSPLVLRVRTASDMKPFEETTLTAEVKSNLSEDADVDVTFELPAEVDVSRAAIVVNDATGTRWLAPEIQSQPSGATSITLRDHLAASKETTYILRLTFVPGDAKAALINTRVAPMTGKIGPLRATTYFRMDSDAINSEGTMIIR